MLKITLATNSSSVNSAGAFSALGRAIQITKRNECLLLFQLSSDSKRSLCYLPNAERTLLFRGTSLKKILVRSARLLRRDGCSEELKVNA